MRFCIKHIAYVERRIPDISQEVRSDMLAQLFLSLADSSLMDQVQNRIENTKSKCPACFYKKPGNEKLNELCIIYNLEQIKLSLAACCECPIHMGRWQKNKLLTI